MRQDRASGGQTVLVDAIVILLVLGAIGGLAYVMASPNRYSKMTDWEFEEDTKKGSLLGAAIIGVERTLRRREADFVIEQKLRMEKDATPSGDHPPEENSESGDNKPSG